MQAYLEYLYSFANASLTLRAIQYLHNNSQITIDSATVINLVDRWLIKFELQYPIDLELAKNIKAFFDEIGLFVDRPSPSIDLALQSLDAGISPTTVMNYYHVAIVAHGKPDIHEIEVFREQIISRLGYCPQTMA
jgi:hypothetical protein